MLKYERQFWMKMRMSYRALKIHSVEYACTLNDHYHLTKMNFIYQ